MKIAEFKYATAAMEQLAKNGKLIVMVKCNDGEIIEGLYYKANVINSDSAYFDITTFDGFVHTPITIDEIEVLFFFNELDFDVFKAYDKIKAFHTYNRTHHFRLLNHIPGALHDDPDEIKARNFYHELKTDIPTIFDMIYNHTEVDW